jgi:hypothetical protein
MLKYEASAMGGVAKELPFAHSTILGYYWVN